MFSKILVAVDGSKSAKKAFARSIYLARKCNSKLDVVHVVPCELGGDSATTFELVEGLKNVAKEILEQCEREATKINVPIRTLFKLGDPARIIIELAKSNNYDLIILGSRGRSTFKELLLGSVSLKVTHHATCPVMVVR